MATSTALIMVTPTTTPMTIITIMMGMTVITTTIIMTIPMIMARITMAKARQAPLFPA